MNAPQSGTIRRTDGTNIAEFAGLRVGIGVDYREYLHWFHQVEIAFARMSGLKAEACLQIRTQSGRGFLSGVRTPRGG